MRHYVLLAALLFFLSCNQKYGEQNTNTKGIFSSDTSGDKLYTTDRQDTGMNSAINNAKQNLLLFDNALKSENKNFEYFGLKKRFETQDGGEHIWIKEIKIFNDGYRGIVNNEPIATNEVKFGDTVSVSRKDVSDWMYLDENVLRGGYTMRYELKLMTPIEKETFLKTLDYKIEE